MFIGLSYLKNKKSFRGRLAVLKIKKVEEKGGFAYIVSKSG